MEVILFASLYRTIEVLIFYVHFFYRRTFYLCGAAEVEFPFFHMKKASGSEKFRGLHGCSQGSLSSTRLDPTLSWLHPPHDHF